MTDMTTLPTGIWAIDPSATTVTISVTKLGFVKVPATLTVLSGSVEIDGSHEVVNVEIIADAASYTSKNPKRNEHVIGPDFLDAASHPAIVFRADRVVEGSNGYVAAGTVTMKGQSAPVEVTVSNVEVSGEAGSFTAAATVDRKSIGVDKMPSFVIGRELQLTVEAKATLTS